MSGRFKTRALCCSCLLAEHPAAAGNYFLFSGARRGVQEHDVVRRLFVDCGGFFSVFALFNTNAGLIESNSRTCNLVESVLVFKPRKDLNW